MIQIWIGLKRYDPRIKFNGNWFCNFGFQACGKTNGQTCYILFMRFEAPVKNTQKMREVHWLIAYFSCVEMPFFDSLLSSLELVLLWKNSEVSNFKRVMALVTTVCR
jgi:hypothetical protein